MAGNIKLEGKLLGEAHRLLEDVCGILGEGGVRYWLEGGTLLGIVREQRLLPWDNDLDISILAEDEHLLVPVLRRIERAGYVVRRRIHERADPPFPEGASRIYKIRRRRWLGLGRGKVYLDIFVKYTQGDESFWLIGPKRRVRKSVPAHFYQDLGTVEFRDRTYPVPRDVEGYLTCRYGDWRIAREEWNSFTDEQTILPNPE